MNQIGILLKASNEQEIKAQSKLGLVWIGKKNRWSLKQKKENRKVMTITEEWTNPFICLGCRIKKLNLDMWEVVWKRLGLI